MKSFVEIVKYAVANGINEIFVVAGQNIMLKSKSGFLKLDDTVLTPSDSEKLVGQAYDSARRQGSFLHADGDDQFSISLQGLTRVRVCAYTQRNSVAMVVKIIPFGIPSPESLGIPGEIMDLASLDDGLILVCGSSGSGRSTTLACLVNEINRSRCCHIVTIERPIEYLFKNSSAFVSQREVSPGSKDDGIYDCLCAARWQSADVVMVSDIPDCRAAEEIISLAENRKLVLCSFISKSCESAAPGIRDLFPTDRRSEIESRLNGVIRAVVFQHLERHGDELVPEFRAIINGR